MRRGDVVAIADLGVQSDLFGALDSVTICPLTSVVQDIPVTRLRIEPSGTLILRTVSWIAVDKITSVRRDRIGQPIGRLSAEDIQRLNGAIAVCLGLGG